MGSKSKIEWTDSTWNPVTGCDKVSPGCDHCYAELIAESKRGTPAFPVGFDVQLRPHKLQDPIRWRKGRMIFVNSMSDMFHEKIPDEYVIEMFGVMAAAPQHIYQILTKRPGRALRLADRVGWPEQIWLGVSVESQDYINRISVLQKVPAVTRFLSCEPLLGPLDLRAKLDGIGWVIDGGESGPSRRPADDGWFRAIRDACSDAGVAYFHKQGNAYRSGNDRILDGRTWDEYPPLPSTFAAAAAS